MSDDWSNGLGRVVEVLAVIAATILVGLALWWIGTGLIGIGDPSCMVWKDQVVEAKYGGQEVIRVCERYEGAAA